MIRNYIKIALRLIWRQRMYAGINILGLMVGIASCLVIVLYIVNELSYDRHFTKADRIFRVTQHFNWDENSMHIPLTSAPYAPALLTDYPAVENAVRFSAEGGGTIQAGNKQLKAANILFADASVFAVFDYVFLYGDPATALSEAKSIVLTRELANKLFGEPAKAMGQIIRFDNHTDNIVTGVIETPSTNSHLSFTALRSFTPGWSSRWQEFEIYTYVLVKEGYSADKLEAAFAQFFDRYLKKEMGNLTYPHQFKMTLQPLTSIHLYSHMEYELGGNGDIRYVYLFVTIAVLLLLIACINYMNLTTARSIKRAKEAGIRKTLGSGRMELAGLYLAESTIIAFIAVVGALLMADIALPFVNHLLDLQLSFSLLGWGKTLLVAFVLVVLVGLLSGSYPAVFLSSFKPVHTLKGNLGTSVGKPMFRQALVTFQFVVSLVLLCCVWVIYKQLAYVNNTSLGFNKEQVLTLHVNDRAARLNVPLLKQKLLQHTGIEAVAAASNPIGVNAMAKAGVFVEQNGVLSKTTQLSHHFMVDADFLSALQIDLVTGRNFETSRSTDQQEGIIVNEAFVLAAGWADPLGRLVAFPEGGTYKVIGVVKDFHIYSLQHAIEPLLMRMAPPQEQDNIYLRISTANMAATLAFIEKTYKDFDAVHTFEVNFLDQSFAKQYKHITQQGQLILAFTCLTLFIACLGLLGLSAFAAEQRTKEIGIRKVLGASVANIVAMLSKDFMKLLGIAIVISSPLAWFMMHAWLEDFAYRIHISPFVFVIAAGILMPIALFTVSYQALKAALANPAASLKNE